MGVVTDKEEGNTTHTKKPQTETANAELRKPPRHKQNPKNTRKRYKQCSNNYFSYVHILMPVSCCKPSETKKWSN